MPPKRKAAGKAKGAGGKKAKAAAPAAPEPEPETSTVKDAIEALKTVEKGKKKSYKVDASCPMSGSAQVHGDYDCMLNQTNVGANNNKFYIIQVLQQGAQFYTWTRWGRVGEPGQNASKGPLGKDLAIKEFTKKFKDKTRNNWDTRSNFNPVAGKYTMLEMDGDDEDVDDTRGKLAKLDEIDGIKRVQAACTLDKQTQDLIKLIFDNDTFHHAMKEMDIDVKKMPLGKLSKAQIAKGFDVLEDLEAAVKNANRAQLEQLTSRFFTLIPHAFGRNRPPILNNLEAVRKKKDMLLVLADIEEAQAMQKDKEKKASFTGDTKEEPHPMDINYQLLDCDLEILDKKEKEFKILEKYLQATEGGWRKVEILDIFKVNRHKESDRFILHDKTENRKLLWHGTNVAVVAAILKGGLRIMPHSGGRVGKGIYFASENGKSAGYVRTSTNNTGIMFLNEVVLGKEHHILRDDWTLTTPPNGFDCIIAKGHTEPDPKLDVTLKIEGHNVTVPQGKPIPQPKFGTSNFGQSEYLVYKESQNRIRYMLKLKM